MIPHRVYVGAIGQGVFRSLDNGDTFRRAADGMFVECDVRALIADPLRSGTLYLGSEHGVFLSRDGADNWQRLPASPEGLEVWSLLLQPGRLTVGVRPATVFISDEDGRSMLPGITTMRSDCPRIFFTRVTCLLADPEDSAHLWAGVEIDGIHESVDGGWTWQRIGEGMTSQDVHSLAFVKTPNGRRLLATTNRDLNLSDDDGRTWRAAGLGKQFPWEYTRGLGPLVGRPEAMLLGCGDGPPGSVGLIARTTDAGETWTVAEMPGRSNSTIWNFATHPADPELVYASSISGQVYRSTDAGASWVKLQREFGEIRGLAWLPVGG